MEDVFEEQEDVAEDSESGETNNSSFTEVKKRDVLWHLFFIFYSGNNPTERAQKRDPICSGPFRLNAYRHPACGLIPSLFP